VKPRAVVIDIGLNSVELISPYVAAAVAAIKDQIPAGFRKYDAVGRTWIVRREMKPTLLRLLSRYYDVLDTSLLSGGAVLQPAPPSGRDAAYAALDLLPSAVPELVTAAYRIKAKKAHPDAGGSHDAMVRVNAAYEFLRK
jgi:hypothetical protein